MDALINAVKSMGYVAAALIAIGTAYVGGGGPIPATQKYVQEREVFILSQTNEVKGRVIELQMQQNTQRRDTFRKEEFDRQQELQKEPGNFAVKQRLDQVRDELELIKRDRERLEKERGN